MPVKFDDVHREELNQNKIYKPKFVWILFVLCEFITFYDRGAMSGALQQIRQDSRISGGDGEILDGTKAGLLTSLFIVGFLIFSPIFTAFAGYFTTRTLLTAGMIMWALSVLLSGLAPNFPTLVFARCMTGVGEAAFTPFQVVTIENIAPAKSRTLWIGVWYAMIAVGTAVGMGAGAVTAAKVQLSDDFQGWQLTFVIEACVGAVFMLFFIFLPKEYNVYDLEATVHNTHEDEVRQALNQRDERVGIDHGDYHVPIWVALKELITNKDFFVINVGYAGYNFFVGSVAAWNVQMMTESVLDVSETTGGLMVGGAMAFCGLVGSAAGGMLVDKYAPVTHPHSVPRAMLFSAICIIIAIPLAGIAFLSQKLWLYLLCFVPGVFCFFALVPAVTISLLGVVPSHLRPYSISVSMIIIHAFGDAISPTITGALSHSFAADCDHAEEAFCLMSQFSNATFDEHNNWLDGECKWIPAPHKGDSPFCANTMQLNKAMLVCLCASVLAIPCWLFIALKRRCCYDFDQKDKSAAVVHHDVSRQDYDIQETERKRVEKEKKEEEKERLAQKKFLEQQAKAREEAQLSQASMKSRGTLNYGSADV